MAVVTNTAHKVYSPHESSEADGGPHWVEIRNLSGSEMDEAQQAKSLRVMEQMGHILKDLQGIKKTPEQLEEEARTKNDIEVRRQVYDPDVLMRHALLSWSYGDLPDNPGEVLDAVTRDWLWDTLVEENTRPPLLSLSGGQS